MSPSRASWHQKVIREILFQIAAFIDSHPLGEVVSDVDVKLRPDLVYRPDVVFRSAAKVAGIGERVTEVPDLVVEVISPESRSYDSQTKRGDYEAAGVSEFWLIDPKRQALRFFVPDSGGYREAAAVGDRYASKVLMAFQLDLGRIQRLF